VAKIVYIDAPAALTRRQRTMGTVITGCMWAAYAYLWLPLVSLFAWGFGFELAYDAMMRAGGVSALRTTLIWYAIMLVDVIVTVAIWSLINKWRFKNRNRRTAHPKVADTAVAHYFGITTETLQRLRSSARVEIQLDADGRPVVDTADNSRPPIERRAAVRGR
jgi:biofilm PGA synthesis protein PgaD